MTKGGVIRGAVALLLLVVGVAGAASRGASPYLGACGDDCWSLTVQDNDVDTSWEMVTADTGFTQMSSDTTVSLGYAATSRWDSIDGGNAGAATITAVWSGGNTADAGPNSLFFKDYSGNGTVTAGISGVFSGAFSAQHAGYLKRIHTSQFDVAGNWGITAWSAGYSASNPGIGAPQIVFSVTTSPDIIQVGYDDRGYLFGRISDDGRTNWDSVAVVADVYDSTYHFWNLRTQSVPGGAQNLVLTVDDNAPVSVAFSNASTALTLDTVSVFSFRSGNDCRCRAEEIWLIEDTTAVDADMRTYSYLRGQEALGNASDSITVHISGIKSSDSTYYGNKRLTAPAGAPVALSDNLMLFEAAWADTDEALPALVWSTGTSVRGAVLDSIPAGEIHYPIAHRVFDWQKGVPSVDRMNFELLSATDTVHVEVRAYPDIADARDLSDGYYQVWRGTLTQSQRHRSLEIDQSLIQGAYLSVFAKGSAANASIQVRMEGRRRRQGGRFW